MAIPYVKQTWTDGAGGGTPVSAARLGVEEQGIFDAHYMPAVHVTHNAAQATTSGVAFVVAFNTERFDQASNAADTMHDTVTNNSRLTCRYAGVYTIGGSVEFASNATGYRQVYIRLNGTTEIADQMTNAIATTVTRMTVTAPAYALAVNDYVELVAVQNSGGGLNVTSTGNYSPEFAMVRVA